MGTGQLEISVGTDVLAAAMLNVLNREGYINNATYLAAKDELKEDGLYADDGKIYQGRD